MGEALIFATGLFGGAALALGGFALGQLAERRRWMAWVKPKRASASFRIEQGAGPVATLSLRESDVRFTGGYRGPAGSGKPMVPPSGGSSVRPPQGGAPDA